MNMSKIGKFESLMIINEFDQALIELYGINMTDARVTRYEVLSSCEENGSARKAAEILGRQRGMQLLPQTEEVGSGATPP